MRLLEMLKTERGQKSYETALVILLLLIIPSLPLGKYGGGIAMVGVSVAGLLGYFALYGARLRSRNQVKRLVLTTAAGAVIAAALVLLVTRGHW